VSERGGPVDEIEPPVPEITAPREGLGDHSPEARRRQAIRWRAGLEEAVDRHVGPGTRFFTVVKRVWTGAYYDGFIHAGNLAYMAILALFPFFITVAAVFALFGESAQGEASIQAFLSAVPPVVGKVVEPVARSVMAARTGTLLWFGGLIGIWTVSSLIETIRDILHRAYGTPATLAFWRYRLLSTGMIVGAVVLLLLSLFAQVAITAAEEVIFAWFPRLDTLAFQLAISRVVPAAGLYLSMFVLFISLTPKAYRGNGYPKWPGALLVTVWWVAVSMLLPGALRMFFRYDLTYGSLAGVMIALFFFWLVGLGMVIGAELNAALAESPEEQDMLGQGDNRARQTRNTDRDT
jgi:membrane protein